jgi:Protein of unknown function (DUF3309)
MTLSYACGIFGNGLKEDRFHQIASGTDPPAQAFRRLALCQDAAHTILSPLSLLLIVVLLVLALGAFPRWGYSKSWGYAPTGTLGKILIIVLVFALLGYL